MYEATEAELKTWEHDRATNMNKARTMLNEVSELLNDTSENTRDEIIALKICYNKLEELYYFLWSHKMPYYAYTQETLSTCRTLLKGVKKHD